MIRNAQRSKMISGDRIVEPFCPGDNYPSHRDQSGMGWSTPPSERQQHYGWEFISPLEQLDSGAGLSPIPRFDEPDGSHGPGKYNGPVQGLMDRGGCEPHSQMNVLSQLREGDSQGPGYFAGPAGQQPPRCDKPGRFDGPAGQPGFLCIDGARNNPGPIRFDSPIQPGAMGFNLHRQDTPQGYDNPPPRSPTPLARLVLWGQGNHLDNRDSPGQN